MDSVAQLALIAKANLVFSTNDTFLSFPALTPISYRASDLNFTQVGTTDTLSVMSEFSRLTNTAPTGALFRPATDPYLWDIYQEVLQTAVVAKSELTSAQQTLLQNAQALLYVQTPDGVQTPSPQVVAYGQYQAAYIAALQAYTAAQMSPPATPPAIPSATPSTSPPPPSADSTSPSVSTATPASAPASPADPHQAVVAAMTNWETLGFKDQVELARQTEASLAPLASFQQWQSWAAQFVPATDLLTDASSQTFALTGFSPADVATAPNWPTISIAANEIPGLVAQAPAALKPVLDAGNASSALATLSVELCSVTLNRPWYRPEVFAARCWHFADPSVKPLSDGAIPPNGRWPAIVTGVIFARNLVTAQQSSPPLSGPPAPPSVHVVPPIVMHPVQIPPPAAHPVVVLPPSPGPAAVAHPAPLVVHPSPAPMVRPPLPAAAVVRPAVPPTAIARLGAVTFQRLPVAAPVANVPTPTPPATVAATQSPPVPTAPVTDPDISILAFICKWLPQCPNPDPTLDWST